MICSVVVLFFPSLPPPFRYFSSSLLLIYDGAECPDNCGRRRNGRKGLRSERARKRKDRHEGKEVLSNGHSTESCAETTEAFSGGNGCAFGQSKQPRVVTPSDASSRLLEDPTCKDSRDSSLTVSADVPFLSSLIADSSTSKGNFSARINGTSARLKLPPSNSSTQDNNHSEAIAMETITGSTSSMGKPPLHHSHPKTTPNAGGATPLLISDSEMAEHRCHVDLRMIDFARSTHEDHYDQVLYEGLDECYLTGLSSLIRIFQEMRDEFS